MGFLDQAEKTKKKRKRRKKNTQLPAKTFKHMISVEKEWPPDTQEQILTYGAVFAFDVQPAFIVRQHLEHDIEILGFTRVTHWYPLKEM